jgi:hypothetical protein
MTGGEKSGGKASEHATQKTIPHTLFHRNASPAVLLPFGKIQNHLCRKCVKQGL